MMVLEDSHEIVINKYRCLPKAEFDLLEKNLTTLLAFTFNQFCITKICTRRVYNVNEGKGKYQKSGQVFF